jgi:hypothetical protein
MRLPCSTIPVFDFCRHRLALMNRRIIQHHDRGIVKALAEFFHDIDNHIATHGSLMLESCELSACPIHKTKKIDPFRAGSRNSQNARSSDILPRIRHARIQAQSRFVEIIKIELAFASRLLRGCLRTNILILLNKTIKIWISGISVG